VTIGEKLKKLRILRGLTQNDLSGEHVSRNMICQIERGNGNPSLQTLQHLAKKLSVSPGYFMSDDEDISKYLIDAAMPHIKQAFNDGRLRDCIRLCEPFTEEKSDELQHILAICYCRCGEENIEVGYLESAKSDFLLARQYAERSCYAKHERILASFHLANLAEPNFPSRFYRNSYPEYMQNVYEFFTYRQILDLISLGKIEAAAGVYDSLSLENVFYRRHINARFSIARFNYERAKALLLEIIRDKEQGKLTVPFIMQIYKDLELCYKSTGDYESAYKCAKHLLAFTENAHH
jgi:transcriptional regulator with XRE-family HTH domain